MAWDEQEVAVWTRRLVQMFLFAMVAVCLFLVSESLPIHPPPATSAVWLMASLRKIMSGNDPTTMRLLRPHLHSRHPALPRTRRPMRPRRRRSIRLCLRQRLSIHFLRPNESR